MIKKCLSELFSTFLFVLLICCLTVTYSYATELRDRDAFAADAEKAEKICEGHHIFAAVHDCKCIAERVVDLRTTTHPATSLNNLIDELQYDCPNPPRLTAYRMKLCLDAIPYFATREKPAAGETTEQTSIRREKVCGCVAEREVANTLADMDARRSGAKPVLPYPDSVKNDAACVKAGKS